MLSVGAHSNNTSSGVLSDRNKRSKERKKKQNIKQKLHKSSSAFRIVRYALVSLKIVEFFLELPAHIRRVLSFQQQLFLRGD